jgi:hypothetical protein
MPNANDILGTVNNEITREIVDALMDAAFYDGIGHWAEIEDFDALDDPYDEDGEQLAVSQMISRGATVTLVEHTDDDEPEVWTLTLKKVIEGIKLHAKESGQTPFAMMDEGDASDGDAVVQYALFGEIVYG